MTIQRREILAGLAAAFVSFTISSEVRKNQGAKVNVSIETIPHHSQRYNTVGDWYQSPKDPNLLEIKVSQMPDWRYSALIAIHELCEAVLCRQAGVTAQQIDVFDLGFKGPGEPGDDPKAPYFPQHQVATQVEKLMAEYLGVEWASYSREVDKVSEAAA